MKHRYLLLVIAIAATGLAACKKENSGGSQYPIVGKWQQTKLRIHIQGTNGATLADTTYLQPFTSFDYAEFKSNGTCLVGTDHYYYPNWEGYPSTPQAIPPNVAAWNYTAAGANFVLSPQSNLTNPGGFVSTDTVSVTNPNILLLHSIFYSHSGIVTTTDSYYTR
ncbi:MAG TPA: hypothetical protein VK668_19830 [Mucilaginibacter sp.]|nr:hypothetical protein [Mucilaginibacter sp.]